MTEQFPWFKCFQSKLLGAMAQMAPSEQLVYVVVLLRIYEHGKCCPDTVDALARRTGYSKRVTADALRSLCDCGRLVLKDNGYFNPVADALLEERRSKNNSASEQNSKAARARWEKAKQNQRKGYAERNASAMRNVAEEKKEEEEGEKKKTPLPPKGGKAKAAKRRDQGHVIPSDWQPADRCIALGRQKGFTTEQISDMAEAMREWSRANAHRKEARKTSWDDTFCNWIRRAVERQGGPNGTNSGPGKPGGAASHRGFAHFAAESARALSEKRSRGPTDPDLPGG
jgi:hypothetical protein